MQKPVSGVVQGEPLIHRVDPSTGRTLHLYVPEPKQWQFHLSDTKHLLIGGVRGTGKSVCIRNDAHARALKWPGFRYLILRRKMSELRSSHLIFLDREMSAFGGFYHNTLHEARYPNGSIGFYGHCENDEDANNYLSAEYGAIYYEELTTFSFDLFNRIKGSARVPKSAPYNPIVRAATNPGGKYEDWVIRAFVEKSIEAKGYDPNAYEYIHTVQGDNPHLPGSYYDDLGGGNEVLHRQWALGEWGIREGTYFPDFQPWRNERDGEPCEPYEWHVINTLPEVNGKPLLEQQWINIYRAVDYGYHPDPAVCLWFAVLPNKQAIVFKERTWHQTPAVEVAQDIVRESEGMRRIVDTFADESMWIDGRRATGMPIAQYFEDNGVCVTQGKNDRVAAGRAIHEWLNTICDGEPKLQIYREGCPSLIRTFPQMQCDPNNAERIADGNDHWVISLAYFCMSDIAASREPRKLSDIPRWKRNPTSNKYAHFRI